MLPETDHAFSIIPGVYPEAGKEDDGLPIAVDFHRHLETIELEELVPYCHSKSYARPALRANLTVHALTPIDPPSWTVGQVEPLSEEDEYALQIGREVLAAKPDDKKMSGFACVRHDTSPGGHLVPFLGYELVDAPKPEPETMSDHEALLEIQTRLQGIKAVVATREFLDKHLADTTS